MPPKENPERAGEEYIHFFACSKQCGVPMAQGSATGCECYETVKSSAAACLIEDGKMLTQDSAWNWNDIYEYGLYSEEDDDYYIPECWWENRRFNPDDVYNNPVDCNVTHWMPLPGAPEGDKA